MVSTNQPADLESLLREAMADIRILKSRLNQPVPIRGWIVGVNSGGDLVARNVATGAETILAVA